jgi:hypothetical protein
LLRYEGVPVPDEHPGFDTSVAHVARVYDYWLGGKDNISQELLDAPHSLAGAGWSSPV